MNIRGVEIDVVDVSGVRCAADILVVSGPSSCACRAKDIIAWPLDLLKNASENELRDAYARVLDRCRKRKVSCVVLTFFDGGLIVSAAARIAAQEVFRFIRAGREVFRLPDFLLIAVRRNEDRAGVKKVFEGYLGHIKDTLAWGPFVTVDTIIETGRGVVLIRRRNPPFGWAIPGGFVDYGESLEEAAAREAREETGLAVSGLRQMHTYSAMGRDPRFQTVTTVFVGRAKGRPKAASDAAAATIVSAKEWKKLDLAFDHRQVLEDYIRFKSEVRNPKIETNPKKKKLK